VPASAPLVARVLPDVSGLDKSFDYLVPDSLAADVAVGSMVRVALHGRRVAGWVIDLPAQSGIAPDRLAALAKWSGIGPSADIVDLAMWTARRWGSPRVTSILSAASPPTMVRRLNQPDRRVAPGGTADSAVQRISPNTDPLPIVLRYAHTGPTLLLHPSPRAWPVIAQRLRRRGLSVAVMPDEWAAAASGVDVVVGGRSAVFAPCPGLRVVVIIDEHDEAYQEERSPTWHARDVAIERARRCDAHCMLVSPAPTVTAVQTGWPLHTPSHAEERSGWPLVHVVDGDDQPPWRRSLLSSELIAELRSTRRVACIINRLGRARISACRRCRTLQRCTTCDAAVQEGTDGMFSCPRCEAVRPKVCQACGSTALANVRPGITRLREELEAAAQRPVVEVSGSTNDLPTADVYVGTEALLHRVGAVDVVAFLDFDAELLAPRYRAGEHAMALLVRAARAVGPRDGGGRIIVHTNVPDHEVIRAVQLADPGLFLKVERERRALLHLPPFGALAAVHGQGAKEFVHEAGLSGSGSADDVLIRNDSWEQLGRALAETPRPKGSRLRVEVDPARR
jgi:primosomal protein N' (replication factor Y) (superfamily II helicase)